MDRTQGGGGSAAADDVHNSVGDYDDTTSLTRPYSIFQAILLDVQGITQILTRLADGGNGEEMAATSMVVMVVAMPTTTSTPSWPPTRPPGPKASTVVMR